MALLSQIEVHKAQTSATEPRGERLYLDAHRNLRMLVRLNLACLFLIIDWIIGHRFLFVALAIVMDWNYFSPHYLTLTKDFLSLHYSGSNSRLTWSEITNAEISEKKDKLVFFSNLDKRIGVPQLNYNKPLLDRLFNELQQRGIEVTTTKRAAYLQTKGTQIEKDRS